jgi:hypothetical protein
LLSVLNIIIAGLSMCMAIISSYLWGYTKIDYYGQWITVGGNSVSMGGYSCESCYPVYRDGCLAISSGGGDINLSRDDNQVAASEKILGSILVTIVLLPIAAFCVAGILSLIGIAWKCATSVTYSRHILNLDWAKRIARLQQKVDGPKHNGLRNLYAFAIITCLLYMVIALPVHITQATRSKTFAAIDVGGSENNTWADCF